MQILFQKFCFEISLFLFFFLYYFSSFTLYVYFIFLTSLLRRVYEWLEIIILCIQILIIYVFIL
jgi:hypothetical protein